jgi:hypothetical protein
MNERIRELAEQAWVYQRRVLNEPNGSRTYTEKEKVFDREKFAELIVQECCNVLQNEDIRHSGYGYNQEFLHKKIKEHFGIEL